MTPLGPGGAAESPTAPSPPSWGLGDVVIGIAVSQVLSVFAVVLVYGTAGWTSTDEVPLWATALLNVPLWAGLVGTVAWASDRKGAGLQADFGLRERWFDVPVGLLVGLASQVILLPLIYLPLLELLDRSSDDLSEPARDLTDKADGAVGWVLLVVVVVVVAPVVEELFYRGLVLRSLQKTGLPDWVAALGSAALFAAMHFQFLQFPGLFVFGLVLAGLTLRTGRLGPAIWAHVAFNATTVAVLYADVAVT